MNVKDRKQCFVVFSRDVDKFCLKVSSELNKNVDVFILTYSESSPEKIDELEKGIKRSVYNRDSLSDTFSGSYPKFHDNDWKIMPGNLDLCQLRFILDHPEYDYFWFCEDDVRYTGNFSELIDEFQAVEDDLLATNRKKFLTAWWHKNSFRSGNHSVVATESLFLPFFRVSRKAALAIIDAYKNGWAGHHEISWLNILEFYGYKVSDFNGFGRTYYTSNTKKLGMGPGTFIYSPSKLIPGIRRNTLYHPIKPPREYFKRQKKRYLSIVRNFFR